MGETHLECNNVITVTCIHRFGRTGMELTQVWVYGNGTYTGLGVWEWDLHRFGSMAMGLTQVLVYGSGTVRVEEGECLTRTTDFNRKG